MKFNKNEIAVLKRLNGLNEDLSGICTLVDATEIADNAISVNSVVGACNRLSAKGCVRAVLRSNPKDRSNAKKYGYAITPDGRKLLAQASKFI